MTNVLYIHTHDSGRYLQPYGYAIPTPNLMRLAGESVLFRQCHCAGPTCSPSRAGLLTGTWPHVNGLIGLAHRGFTMRDYDMHLVRHLNAHGFETALCGIQHEAAQPEMIGYRHIFNRIKGGVAIPDKADYDMQNARSACEYLLDRAKKNATDSPQPFFLSVGLVNTHRPFPDDTGDIRQEYLQPPLPMYDCRENRQDMAGYIASAGIADRCVGMVLDALRQAGLEDNTIVLFTTDHGIAFPRMKCHLYDTGTGVAMMMKVPGNPAAGSATDALVSHIDVFPTLCDLLGLPTPPTVQGRSLMPILQDQMAEVNEAVFSEVNYHGAYEPMRCVRTSRYKLIRRYDWHNGPIGCNVDDGVAKSFYLNAGYYGRPLAREMLFDLHLDPMERENLVGDPTYQEVYNDLSARLARWMEDTNDPLLRVGHRIPAPPGASVNTRTCVEVKEDAELE